MARPPEKPHRDLRWWGLPILVLSILVCSGAPSAHAQAYPVLPLEDDSQFLEGLTVPPLSPGASGTLTFVVHNPLAGPLSNVSVSLEFYAFNGYPGNATGPLSNGTAPAFVSFTGGLPASVENVTLHYASLAASGSVAVQQSVAVPSVAPAGTFAIRTAIRFSFSGTEYLLESRGFFTTTEWNYATEPGPNGTSMLNVSRLGVSGVTAETAVFVPTSGIDYFLYALLGVSILLAGLAAFYIFRRGPGSKSGRRGPESPQSAPSAFGNKRTKEGD